MPKVPGTLELKLRPPARRQDGVARARLTDSLLKNIESKLQLVVAPAGYGKTTALADLTASAPITVAWLALDRADRDPRSFIEYLVAALQQAFPSCGISTLAQVQSTSDIHARTAALARALAADVAENLPSVCLLILDDFHEVNESADVIAFMDDLLRLLPENLRILIASRSLPNLTVSKLAMEGDLFGIGKAELAFTPEEIRDLFQGRYRTALNLSQATELADQCEGWIAGLLLSAHNLWGGLMETMIAERGPSGPLYEYLAGQAYDQQPPDVQRFLLTSSVLTVLDAPALTTLLGDGAWAQRLEDAEQENLFVTRLSSAPPTFRFHQLFRDFLQARFLREQREEFERLHRSAAVLMAGRAQWSEALDHYHRAEAYPEAADLIAQVAPLLEREGRWYQLAAAVDALPESVRESDARLLLARARAARRADEYSVAESYARRALALSPNHVIEGTTLHVAALHTLGGILRLAGRTQEAEANLREALAQADDNEALAADIRRDLGLCLGVRGDFIAAIQQFERADAYFDRVDDLRQAARTEVALGMALARTGRAEAACEQYERALVRWRSAGDEADDVALTHNNLGYLRYLQGEPEVARRLLDEGLSIARRNSQARAEAAIEHSRGSLLLAGGETAAAVAAYRQMLAVSEQLGELWYVTSACEGLALCALAGGAGGEAAAWLARAAVLAERQQSPYLQALISMHQAIVDLRRGSTEQALTSLSAARETFVRADARRDLVRVEIALAFAHAQAGAVPPAVAHFQAGLSAAHRLGLPALLDLAALWDPATFAALDPGEDRPVRDAALIRINRTAPPPPPAPSAELLPLPRLSVRSFGIGDVNLPDGAPVEWKREKAREVFFYLLHNGPTRTERLIAEIWPDASESAGRAGLYSATYTVRRIVHEEGLRKTRAALELSASLVAHHDAGEFNRALRLAEDAVGPGERAELLEQARAKYVGPLLDGIDSEWAVVLRRVYEERYLALLERLAVTYVELGDWHASLEVAEAGMRAEPRASYFLSALRSRIALRDPYGALRLLRLGKRLERGILDSTAMREIERLNREITRMLDG